MPAAEPFAPFPLMTVLVAESPLEFKRSSGRTLKVKTGDRFVVTGNALSQRYGHVLIARERGAHLGVGELISAEHAHSFFYVAP